MLRAPLGNTTESVNNFNLFKNKALELSKINNVAASWTIPGEVKPSLQTFQRKEKPLGNLVALNGVSHDFIDTYDFYDSDFTYYISVVDIFGNESTPIKCSAMNYKEINI